MGLKNSGIAKYLKRRQRGSLLKEQGVVVTVLSRGRDRIGTFDSFVHTPTGAWTILIGKVWCLFAASPYPVTRAGRRRTCPAYHSMLQTD